MQDDGYEACGTMRVDMRERIIGRMIDSPDYMAAIPLTVAELRKEGDSEGADELESMVAEARLRIDAMDVPSVSHRRGRKSSGAVDGDAVAALIV